VAIYVRWSTDEQGEGTTLQEQLERCKSYVASQGWRPNEHLVFVDEGYSGATLNRPALTRLRGLVRKGEVDCVVSLKIDRLSRSLVDCVELVLREWAGTCHYKSVSQPVNTTDELSRVFFAILAGFAEYERALIRERTHSGLLRRVREGNFWGSGKAPFGYNRVGKGTLAVNDQEAALVRQIFRMAAEGLGPNAIASRLNVDGIPGPEGKGWWTYTVRNILRSRIYIGYLEYGKRYVDQKQKTAGGNRILRKRKEPLVKPDSRTAALILVPDEQFEAAQRLLDALAARSKTRGSGAKSNHMLIGLSRCRCGGPMITGYDALKRRYYRCQHRDKSRGRAGCPIAGGFVYAHQIEPTISQEIKKRFSDPEKAKELVAKRWHAEREDSGNTDVYRHAWDDLARKEQRLEQDRNRVVRQARRGEITLAEKRSFEEDIARESQELAAQRMALERRIAAAEASGNELAALLDWVARVDEWDELEPDTQKECLRRLVDHLVLYKPMGRGTEVEVDFHWRV
jgi:site-specific DNA recombinase